MNTAQVNGTEIAYHIHGPKDGTPVVLSHSLFFDHTMFDVLAGLYAEQGLLTIAYDHRGQGVSADATLDQLAVDCLAADAAALITHLGVGPVHFVGNSLGGMVGLRLGARRADLVRSVVALGSSAEEEHKVKEYAPLAAHLSVHGTQGRVDDIMHIMFGDDSLAQDSEMIRTWRQHIVNLPPRIGLATHSVIYRGRIIEELSLAGSSVPVLAIAGNQDHAYPAPISSSNIAEATGGRTVTVAGAGHSVALEQPRAVFDETMNFFTEVDQA